MASIIVDEPTEDAPVEQPASPSVPPQLQPELPVENQPPETTQQAEEPSTAFAVANPSVPKSFKLSIKKLGMVSGLAVVLILVLLLVNSNREKNQLKQQTAKTLGAQTQTEDEAKSLKNEVGKFLELPADELPTVATVSDASKVKNQAFFANSQNGDKVLLFSKAGKAVLYRPSTKKIIEVAPINLNNPATTDTKTVTPPPPSTNRR